MPTPDGRHGSDVGGLATERESTGRDSGWTWRERRSEVCVEGVARDDQERICLRN